MLNNLFKKLKDKWKGGVFMMIMLFAINIAKDEDKGIKFSKVPPKLQKAVKKQLELIVLDEQELARLLAQ